MKKKRERKRANINYIYKSAAVLGEIVKLIYSDDEIVVLFLQTNNKTNKKKR